MRERGNPAATPDSVTVEELPLTAGVIAMTNLQAQIDGIQRRLMEGCPTTVGDQTELIELVALRGQILGRVTDYEWAEEQAERLINNAPADGGAFVTRARARGRFHRFTDALADLDKAQQLGADPAVVDAERASVFQAIGRYELALAIYNAAASRRTDFGCLGALALLHAERGEIATAERLFDESLNLYRGVSPFPLALLAFQRGLMWLTESNLLKAHTWFEAAIRLLPAYAPAQGHMAEIEAALGEPGAAIARLLPLTTSSDDSDYAASLARIFRDAARVEEAGEWRNKAAARYDDLMTRHPEAFADHAAEFWLEAGDDPHQALRFAKMNLEVRQTPRARELFARATLASEAVQTVPSCIVKV
jgi:tetratricopeptide (TPR) repeat protein